MLEFKRVCHEDIGVINGFFKKQDYKTCDFTLGGLFMWSDFFNYEYCVYENTLFIRGDDVTADRPLCYALPLGELSLHDALKVLKVDCREKGVPLVFNSVPETELQLFDCNCARCAEELPDWSDYIYDADALATLVGHKYNKKRNKVNFFRAAFPDYSTEVIGKDNLDEIIAFFENYVRTDDDTSDYAKNEDAQTMRVLKTYDDWGFDGLVLRVNGEIAAFTVGEIIGDVLYDHIEKADADKFPGAYQIINMLFADRVRSEFGVKFINREEDVGDEGLRQSKLSYHPVMVLKKYKVEFD